MKRLGLAWQWVKSSDSRVPPAVELQVLDPKTLRVVLIAEVPAEQVSALLSGTFVTVDGEVR